MTLSSNHSLRYAIRGFIGTALMLLFVLALSGCSEEGQQETTETGPEQATEQTTDSIESHGSTYEKEETVQATTTLSGKVTNIAVSEWLKNPSEKKTISDASDLKNIATDDDVSFTQKGTKVKWKTKGKDVHYSGTTDKDLPFSISYSFKLNGKEVKPSTLKNVTGSLKIELAYENNTSATIKASGSSHSIKDPYVMASMMSFDAEHAKNVKVDNGKVLDQEGSLVAVGIAMPGLAKTLGLDDQVNLPESVTISADVVGFDMPDITTMATDQALGMIDEKTTDDIDSKVDEMFEKISSVKKATKQLSSGMSKVDEALERINEGQKKLNEAFPNATNGLDKLSEGADGIEKLYDASSQTLQASISSQQEAQKSVEELESIDKTGMSDEAAQALDESIGKAKKSLTKALETTHAASTQNGKAREASGQLSTGLKSVKEGLEKIQAGYKKLSEANSKINTATKKLSEGSETLSKGISNMISKAQGGIDGKLKLISAIRDYVDSKGAYCGNAKDMPGSTTFTVIAKADA